MPPAPSADSLLLSEFLSLLTDLSLEEVYSQILQPQGLDDWKTIREVDEGGLQEVGLSAQSDQIMACIASIKQIEDQVYEEYGEQGAGLGEQPNGLEESQQISQVICQDTFDVGSQGGSQLPIHSPVSPAQLQEKETPIPVSVAKIERLSYKKINKGENDRAFFKRLLHLYPKQSKINSLKNIDLFPSLRILDLSSNRLTCIKELSPLQQLESLNLEDNRIQKIEGLLSMSQLKKLYLGRNNIKRLEGLYGCCRLQEISLNKQNITQDEEFTIEGDSTIGLSESLLSLDLSFCGLVSLAGLEYLRRVSFTNRLCQYGGSSGKQDRKSGGIWEGSRWDGLPPTAVYIFESFDCLPTQIQRPTRLALSFFGGIGWQGGLKT